MFSHRDYKFLSAARSLATTSKHPKARVGAVLVDRGDVVSVGVNGNKSHPLQQKYNRLRFRDDDVSAMGHLMHAEIEALVKGREYFTHHHAAIYVYRIMKNGDKGMSRPCPGCIQALLDFGVKRMYYTTTDGIVYEEIASGSKA